MEDNQPKLVSKYNIHHLLGSLSGRLICALTMTNAKVFGEENLKDVPRPYVLAINHASHLDPPVMWGYFPDYFNFMMKESLGKIPVFGRVNRTSGNILINREGSDVAALKASLRHLRAGYNLAIFVEGTRSMDGRLQEFKEGAVNLASKVRAPIVPVYLSGTHRILGKHSFLPSVLPCEMHILPALMQANEQKLDSEGVTALNSVLYDVLSEAQDKYFKA